ncbi:helix-turn-helix transcriptional regulator [Bradyrhizobium sp. AZCC 2230]|uniref:helix-turn-helix transcriptional regulator n=1 Tax=Bradyrhizobium sp. AZCC 2230 TaxID=3117021 RepID=UPI00306AA00E
MSAQGASAEIIPFHQRPTCTVKEACRATGLSRTTLYERMADGTLLTKPVGRRRLVNVKSLLKLVGAEPEAGSLA